MSTSNENDAISTSSSRRSVLRWSTIAAAALAGCATSETRRRSTAGVTTDQHEPSHGLGAEEAETIAAATETEFLRVWLSEEDGSTLSPDRAKLLHARDLNNDPLPRSVPRAEARVRVGLVREEPMQVVCRLKVPNFGEVYCYADNEGKGYARPGEIEFVVDAARTRRHRVRRALLAARQTGVPLGDAFYRHYRAAQIPLPAGPREARIAAAYASLGHALHAGELLALESARHRIARFAAPRKDFGFGVMVSRYGQDPKYDEAVRNAFNFATVAWYTWKSPEPPYVDYARMDGSIDYCLANGLTPKGFGYCYMARGATPEWIRPVEIPATTLPTGQQAPAQREYNPDWPYEKIKKLYEDVNRQTCRHYLEKYGDKIPTIEILNEAHDKANLWHMSQERILDMAVAVSQAARQGHPRIRRMFNHCCQWGEYAVRRNDDGSRRWSPLMFAKDALDAGAQFEVLGLQLYYPQYDVFEIDRMLQRHFVLDRPIQITEMSAHSQPGFDLESMRPKTVSAPWHGEAWSESTQADWTEAMFTLMYSHRQVEACGWWDLDDAGGHFWPHGGLLRKDRSPKESYHRLLKIQKDWGVSRVSV